MDISKIVADAVKVVSGESVRFGNISVNVPDVNRLDVSIDADSEELRIRFTGKKPVFEWFIFKGSVNGVDLSSCGVKMDVVGLPKRVDPFISWSELTLE